MKTIIIALLAGLCISSTLAQESRIYELEKAKEIPLLTAGAGLTGLGYILERNIQPLSEETINTLDVNNIIGIDRFATRYWSTPLSNVSDYILTGGMVLPFGLAISARARKQAGPVAVMYLESFLITEGVTNVTKALVKRKRPFVYNPEVGLDRKMSRTAQKSYFSGHVSTAAVSSFFFAQVFNDLYPNSPHRKWIWTASATLPAVVGYLRIRSGRHYLTDVLSGYAVGALSGIFIPRMHRNQDSKLTFQPGLNTVGFTYSF